MTDIEFDIFDSFLSGFKVTTFSKNMPVCSLRLRTTINDYNRTFIKFQNSPSIKPEEYAFNFTRIVSNSSADAAGDCFTAAY
jgi:hypothetical protein